METVIEAAATFIANVLLQVTVLLLMALVCARLMLRTAPARRQYLFWVGVLTLSVGLPVFSLFTFRDNSRFTVRLPFENNPTNIENVSGVVINATGGASSIQSSAQAGAFDASIVLQAMCICYFLFLSFRLYHFLKTWRQTMRMRHLVKNEKLSPLFDKVLERCCGALEITAVPIFFSAETAAPLTLGAGKPIIILPESLITITCEKTLTAVLGHELAHIRRRDYGWNLFFEFISLPILFHPAVTIMKRNIHQTREMACDELVSESLLKPLDYARSLVEIAGFITPSSQTAYTLGVFNADILEKRIMKLIETSRGAYERAGKIKFLFAVTLLGTTAMVTSVFSLVVPFKQKPETEKIAIPADYMNQDNDPKIVNIGVMNGKAVKLPLPEYPDEARRANVGGSVSVQVIVDEEGNVASANAIPVVIKIIKRDGTETNFNPEETAARKLLNEAAEIAAKEAKFAPTILSGKPVRVKGIIVYNFSAAKDIDRKTISDEVLNGKATSLPLPEYPAAAKAVKAAGAVQIQVVVDEEGNVTSAEAVSGHPLLRQAAVKAAKEAKFSQTFLNGQAVKVNGVLVYNFASATNEPGAIYENRDSIKGDTSAEEFSGDPLKILSKPTPQYTDEARKNNVTGTIKLRVTFLASGAIGDISAENTLPDGLTENAIEAARGIKFKPATRNGEPLTVTKLVEYSFSSF